MRNNMWMCLLLLFVSTQANAMDHRGQWGVGAALGGAFAAPWSQNAFESNVGIGPSGSIWTRFVPGTPEVGFEVSYNYFQLSKMEMKTHALIGSFFSRQNPWGSFHPFYAFGVGWQKTANFFATGDWETPIFKLTAGIEFEMNERSDLGIYFNHYTIFKNAGTEANAHVLAPSITYTYYFGTPEPMPIPASPVPVPVPVVTAPVAPPPVAVQNPTPAPFENLKAKPPVKKKPVLKKAAPKRKRNR